MAILRSESSVVNEPTPFPTCFLLPLVVGFLEVLQTIPRSVTSAPPVAVTLPPTFAELVVTSVASDVFTVGLTAVVVNETSSPYDVPLALVA